MPCSVSESKGVVWYFNGNKITPGGRFTMSGNTLLIQNLLPCDGGEFVCKTEGIQTEKFQLAIVELFLSNVTTITGESPHWVSKTQSLLFVDNFGQQLHRWNSLTGQHEIETFSGFVGQVVPYTYDGYIMAVGRSINYFNWETKQLKKLQEVDAGKPSNVINDGKVDPAGRLWGGTFEMPKDTNDLDPIRYKGSMYMMDLDGTLHIKRKNISASNGFAWTADHKTMYYVDSYPGKILRFDYDVKTGDIEYEGIAIDFEGKGMGFPDGMSIDSEGMIWVACYLAGKVIRFNPNTGEKLRIIDFKGMTRRVTSCCFGGPKLDVLYVTSGVAQTAEEQEKDRFSGSLFRVTGLGIRGLPGRAYQGIVSNFTTLGISH